MKFKIILFVLGFCFNMAAPYKHAVYQQGAYQQPNYPQDPSPHYPAPSPAVINYRPPQQAVNYALSPSDTQYLERKSEQQHPEAIQRRVEEHSDTIFVEQPPQVYSHHLPSPTPETNYNSYGQVSPTEYPQGSRQWGPRNSHQSGLPVQQHYRGSIGHPQWQTGGYKAIPHQNEYYGTYERQYNKPLPYAAQPQAKPVDISPTIERKAEGLNQHEYGSHYEQRNVYNPHVQYVPHQAQGVEALLNTERTQSVQPQSGYNGSFGSNERQKAYNTEESLEQVKIEETSLDLERTEIVKEQNENFGSPYEQQNAFNTPFDAQPQQVMAVASSDSGTKTQAPLHNTYLDSSYELQNTYITPQYLAQPQLVKPVEPSSISDMQIQVIPQQNEHYGIHYDQKITHDSPVQYVAPPKQVKIVEAPLYSETKNQEIKQQNESYGSPYEHRNQYKPLVHYLAHPQQAKPVEPSSTSEPNAYYYGNHYEKQNAYTPVQHAQPQQVKPVQEPLVSEMTAHVINQQNEYNGSPYAHNNARDVPVHYVAQPQQDKAVAEASSISVPKAQEAQPQIEYYDNSYEQKHVLNTPMQHVAQPQEVKAVAEASSVPETKHQAVHPQNKYYDSYEQQNVYNAPAQHTAKAESVLSSATNIPKQIVSKTEVLDYLDSTPQKGRYLIIHQNGTVEHVNTIDDKILGNYQYFKSSDLRKRTTKTKEFKVSTQNKTASPSSPLNIDDKNKTPSNSNKIVQYVPHPRPIVSKEVKPAALPIAKDNIKDHYVPIQTNYDSYTEASTKLPEPVNYNYHPISDSKHNPIEPHKKKPYKSEYYPRTWKNHKIYPLNEKKPVNEVLYPVQKPNVKIYADSWRNNQEKYPIKPLSPSSFQSNSKNNYSSETVELNDNRKPANKGHWSPINNEGNNYNPLENILFNNPSNVQNNYDDTTNPPEYDATPVAYHKDVDALNPLFEPATTAALPSNSQNIPKKPDGVNTPAAIAPPQSSDILDNFAQKPIQEFDDGTSSYVQNYSEAANTPTEEFKDLITETLLTKPDNIKNGYPVIGDVYNNTDITVDETTPRTTEVQDTINESDIDDDDEQALVETNTEYINNNPVIIEDKMTKSPEKDITAITPKAKITAFAPADDESKLSRVETLNTDSITDAIAGDKKANKEGQRNKDVFVTKDATTEKQLGENEVVVDDAFWDAVYSTNDTGGFNDLFIFNVKVDAPVFEKNSRSFVLENGTYVEEIEEIFWEHKDDDYPKEMKFTRITRNQDPESIRSGKAKLKSPVYGH